MNIIAGIFVNDAIELSQRDRDFVLHSEYTRNKAMMKELKDVFHELDTDLSDTLSLQEFMKAFERPQVLARFRHLGVELMDARSLFEMLDISEDDELSIDEFVTMCLRAKSLTRPVDFQSFIQHNRRNSEWVRKGLSRIDQHLLKLAVKMDAVLVRPRGI
uniref:EF-hand domain-containing protein n=1 Tax=Noctiluca scintillans TaxID=2966 RepID=A0A7S1APU8_NOCSC